MTIIYFRSGLLDDLSTHQRRFCQKALHNFLERPTHGTNLEKLQTKGSSQPLYSIRVNDTIRIILASVNHNQRQQWLAVDILLNHQYKVSG